jgi:hypothetical protein
MQLLVSESDTMSYNRLNKIDSRKNNAEIEKKKGWNLYIKKYSVFV